jgi:hypothetical protein
MRDVVLNQYPNLLVMQRKSAADLVKSSVNSRAGIHSQNELFPLRRINSCGSFPNRMCSLPAGGELCNYCALCRSFACVNVCVRLWHGMKWKRVTRSQELYNARALRLAGNTLLLVGTVGCRVSILAWRRSAASGGGEPFTRPVAAAELGRRSNRSLRKTLLVRW